MQSQSLTSFQDRTRSQNGGDIALERGKLLNVCIFKETAKRQNSFKEKEGRVFSFCSNNLCTALSAFTCYLLYVG